MTAGPTPRPRAAASIVCGLILWGTGAGWGADPAGVEIVRVPGGGVQPKVVVDAAETVHLLFLRGDPAKCDVWYTRRPLGEAGFREPRRVNSVAGSAIAVGTIRGAQFALDGTGKLLVVWNGNGDSDTHVGAPFWFSRQRDDGSFSPQRDLARTTAHLDGGGAVAATPSGQAFAVWQSAPAGTTGETNRGVFVAASTDNGATFGNEQRFDDPGNGACPCCGLAAAARDDGTLAVLYRTASDGGTFRDMTLLFRPPAAAVQRVVLDRWSLNQCPMSSASLAWTADGLLAAWETRETVQWALVNFPTGVPTRFDPPPGGGKRKHPSVAVRRGGDLLLTWVEGTGWARGGELVWQLYDARRQPVGSPGRRDGVPVWGSAAAFAVGDRFGIVY